MMSIVWIIIGYLVIGVMVSFVFGKLSRSNVSDTDYVLFMYMWPILLLIIMFMLGPAWLVGYLRMKREKREEAKRHKRLLENCAKCALDDDERCPKHLRPYLRQCYVEPREEKKNDQTK